tara:strand:+ start:672 stop:911 length:240 start_codon:yes stop_codon:yes gene_type:complete
VTPKEWAFKLIDALDAARRSGEVVHEHELTEAAFDDAIIAEREMCAMIADAYAAEPWGHPEQGTMCAHIAAGIRARGQT